MSARGFFSLSEAKEDQMSVRLTIIPILLTVLAILLIPDLAGPRRSNRSRRSSTMVSICS